MTRGDLDDWFAETTPEPVRPPQAGLAEEDWLREDTRTTRTRRRARPKTIPRGGRIALGVGVVGAFLLVLWGAGAFGGGGPSTKPAATATHAAPPAASAPAPAPIQAPATTLAPGSSGAQVKRLQHALAQLGYSPGQVDGSYGPGTEKALKRFQQANGLQPDGVLGAKTLRALKSKRAAR
jgi:hypothetical protein